MAPDNPDPFGGSPENWSRADDSTDGDDPTDSWPPTDLDELARLNE